MIEFLRRWLKDWMLWVIGRRPISRGTNSFHWKHFNSIRLPWAINKTTAGSQERRQATPFFIELINWGMELEWKSWLKWSEREDWIELVGMKTYNLLCRNLKDKFYLSMEAATNKSNQSSFHFTQRKVNFLFMKFNESFWFIEENEKIL